MPSLSSHSVLTLVTSASWDPKSSSIPSSQIPTSQRLFPRSLTHAYKVVPLMCDAPCTRTLSCLVVQRCSRTSAADYNATWNVLLTLGSSSARSLAEGASRQSPWRCKSFPITCKDMLSGLGAACWHLRRSSTRCATRRRRTKNVGPASAVTTPCLVPWHRSVFCSFFGHCVLLAANLSRPIDWFTLPFSPPLVLFFRYYTISFLSWGLNGSSAAVLGLQVVSTLIARFRSF